MKYFYVVIFLWSSCFLQAQSNEDKILSLQEFLGYVKLYHPMVKQANLTLTQAEAKLLKARGAFDPKLAYKLSKKEYKDKEYYDKQDVLFKIPTWYGVEFKAAYENNTGEYLNPESTVPEDGLFSAGVSVSVAKNLLINDRMAQLKQAKLFNKQAEAEQQLQVNQILHDATKTYAKWLQLYKNNSVYNSFLTNAETRFSGIVKSFKAGDKAAIDTVEAAVLVDNRMLLQEKSRLALLKARLELSNYLWSSENTPVELQEDVLPDVNVVTNFVTEELIDTIQFKANEHPKFTSLQFKQQSLVVEKRLKMNNLLPEVNLQYNFLTEKPREINSLTRANYKGGIEVKFPLFLRKERGDLKLAKAKLNDIDFELQQQKVILDNKFTATKTAIQSYKKQLKTAKKMVKGYQTMVAAEERKFTLGDSSLFLINSREAKLIEAKLKAIETENKLLEERANLILLNQQL
ncbi:TolC family protein [Tenacibaculum geojense]|uniref:TolC family protein n=1 Tax=Tenacibaculum geojense TaxID=915352 RepID=A0ABW3JRZ4_9FLAO